MKLEERDIVDVCENLKPQLIGESSKCRQKSRSKLLPKELWEAAKQLKEHERVTVLRADKTNCYVILNKDEYKSNLDSILKD